VLLIRVEGRIVGNRLLFLLSEYTLDRDTGLKVREMDTGIIKPNYNIVYREAN
jgi:hypothetical protein